MREFVHYGIHFLVPIILAFTVFKKQRNKALLIFLGAIIIDIDHVLAVPIFDPNRCSIGFHPLHSYWAIALYVILCIPKTSRLIGFALCLHILADIIDCFWIKTVGF